eukprot:285786-Chlamydomonas_euryale.AAC.3
MARNGRPRHRSTDTHTTRLPTPPQHRHSHHTPAHAPAAQTLTPHTRPHHCSANTHTARPSTISALASRLVVFCHAGMTATRR